MPDHELFELGDVGLQSGITLRDAKLAYKTYGTLAASRDNVVVMPTPEIHRAHGVNAFAETTVSLSLGLSH
jgi:homoserine acetyltransferase